MRIKWVYIIGSTVMACPIYANVPSFVGDIVGRDLIGAGPVGHIGLASAPDRRMRPTIIMEAMDTAPHIQVNSIDDFKSRSRFWGSKGGLVSPQSYESYLVANRIVRQYYACPEYSYSWMWKEGKIDGNSRPISCGQFRCDTLINYAYAFSERYSLPTYNTIWTTPLAIYNYFPVASDLFKPEERSSSPSFLPPISISDLSSINEHNLNELNEERFYQMLQNSSNLSKEQIQNLWQLFTSYHVDSKIKVLFYNFLSFEAPCYLTNEIINQAKKEEGESKHQLLVILQAIYQKRLERNETMGLEEIANYFKELQAQHLDKNDGGIVFRGIATLAPKYLKPQKAQLTNMDKIHVDVLSIKNDRAHELDYVNDIIYNLEHPDDGLVVTASYQYLTLLLIKDLNIISNESKQLFRNHLEHKNITNHNQSLLYPSAYIEFKAALDARKAGEIPKLTYKYLFLFNPDEPEALTYGFSEFTQKRLKTMSH